MREQRAVDNHQKAFLLPTALTTVFLSMALMASISTFVRSYADRTDVWWWLVVYFPYFAFYRIKIYLDDLQFTEITSRENLYKPEAENKRGWETLLAVLSWTLWIAAAVLLDNLFLFFVLNGINFTIVFAWILVDERYLIEQSKSVIAAVFKVWKIANVGAIAGSAVVAVGSSSLFSGSWPCVLKVIGLVILWGFFIYDIFMSKKFTLGLHNNPT